MQYKELFEQTYKGKKILLTGHTGFKGAWLLAWLHQLGAVVKGYALAPEHDNDLYALIHGDTLCDSVIADIRDKEKLAQVVHAFQPDFIFHLAAQPLVRRSYEMPLYTFEVNVNGTAHVLEAMRGLAGTCYAVIITTDKVYENHETGQAYKETDHLGGYDPYSASKAAAEIVVSSYRNSFFHPAGFGVHHHKAVASARAGNVIGGGDRAADRIVPDIIRALESGQPVQVRNPKSVRPWQHVLEPLSGYLLLGARLAQDPARFASAWNFGPYEEDVLTVEQLVQLALPVYGGGSYESPRLEAQPHEAHLLHLDISKALQQLQWKPRMNAAAAIRQTIQWYKEARSIDAAALTKQQIQQYQQS